MASCSTLPCLKFIICALISLGTTLFACIMLATNGFDDTALTAFCTSLICSNLSFWCQPPKVKSDQNGGL